MSHVKVVLWYGATSRTRSRVNVEKAGMLQGIRYILVGCFKPGLRVGYVTFFHFNTQDDEQQMHMTTSLRTLPHTTTSYAVYLWSFDGLDMRNWLAPITEHHMVDISPKFGLNSDV